MKVDINDGGGGYDLEALKQAKEGLSEMKDKDLPKNVEPMYIDVLEGEVTETKEMGTREVFIDYDALGNIIGVELL